MSVPSILSGIADVSGVGDRSPLLDAAWVYDSIILDGGSRRGCDTGRQKGQSGQNQSLLHLRCQGAVVVVLERVFGKRLAGC